MNAQNIETIRANAEAAVKALREAEAAEQARIAAEAKAAREAEMKAKAEKANADRIFRIGRVTKHVFAKLQSLSIINGDDDYLTKRGYSIELYGDNDFAFGLVNSRGERQYLGTLCIADTMKNKRVSFNSKAFNQLKLGSYNYDAIADLIRQQAINEIAHSEKKSREVSNESVRDAIIERAKIAKHNSPIHASYWKEGYRREGGQVMVADQGKLYAKFCAQVTHEQAEKLVQAMIEIGILQAK